MAQRAASARCCRVGSALRAVDKRAPGALRYAYARQLPPRRRRRYMHAAAQAAAPVMPFADSALLQQMKRVLRRCLMRRFFDA